MCSYGTRRVVTVSSQPQFYVPIQMEKHVTVGRGLSPVRVASCRGLHVDWGNASVS